MKLIVDTQAFLWMTSAPNLLPRPAQVAITEPTNEILLSAVSAWEIAIKASLGKLTLPLPPADYVRTRVVRHSLTPLPVLHEHALHVAALPHYHRDPFDRLLAAQCLLESVPVITADAVFARYGVTVVWDGAGI